MASYIVKAGVVKVSVGALDGNRVARILREGATVPEGVAEEQLASLAKRGLIRKVTARQAAAAAASKPDDDAGDNDGDGDESPAGDEK